MYYGQQDDQHDNNKNKYNDHNNEHNNQHDYSNTTTTTTTTKLCSTSSSSIHTDPGVFCPDEVIEQIAQCYFECISPEVPAMAAHLMERCLANGMMPELIIDAIRQTGWAKRPSPQYLRAILNRCEAEGIKTLAQYKAAQQQRNNNGIRSAWKSPALNYQQHTYTEDDYVFYDPMQDL